MFFDSAVRCDFIKPDTERLLVVEPTTKSISSLKWFEENRPLIEEYLIKFGGILFRNFDVHSVSEFNQIVQVICPNLLDYVYRSTPRTKLGGKIYTATEYPADRIIPMHNENSYSQSWPAKIFFFSVVVASEGGETPVADSCAVYRKIDPLIKRKFEQKGVLYVRNYNPGIDLSWQDVFQTDKKEEVGQFCKEHHIDFEWMESDGPELVTKQVCQASIIHPLSRDRVWFNQAHLFHSSSLADEERLSLIRELGVDNLPRNTFYGDGEQIEIEVLDHIRHVYEEEKIKFKWQKGDIMLLDNILTAHGRETYKGERKVAVAMA